MSNYVAIVFKSDAKAHDALRRLWNMDDAGDLTVHGAAVVRRGDSGNIEVASKHTDAGMRTAVGIGVGMLLGALAGPIVVAGAVAATVGAAIGLGAAAGGAVGLTADVIKSADRDDAGVQAFYTLQYGESAVVAEVSEEWPSRLDEAVREMGGVVYRRYDSSNLFGDYASPAYYNNYLYPYYYEPTYFY